MASSTQITRTQLYALMRQFHEDEEQRRYEERLAMERAEAEARAIAEINRQAEERARQEAMRLKAEQLVKDVVKQALNAASKGEHTIVVELGEVWQWWAIIVEGIRREIQDICVNVHEYDTNDAVGGFFSSKMKSISVSWRPGSGRGSLG